MNLARFFVPFIAACAVFSQGALAQAAWPDKPIKLLVGFPAGGSVDQVARTLGQKLSTALGQPIVVENRAGASGTIATSMLVAAPADGYTFAMVWDTHAVMPSLMRKLGYDTLKDLDYIGLVGTSPFVLVTSPKGPLASFPQLVDAARAGKARSYGSSGNGSLGHLTALQLFNRLQLNLTHIPYKGGAPMVQDTLGQQVDVSIGSVFLLKPYIDAGTLRPLAVTSTARSAALPAVATVAAGGAAGFHAVSWWGVVAPAGLPRPIATRMHAEMQKALADPVVARQLTSQGMALSSASPAEFRSFVGQQMEEWAAVVKTHHVQMD